MKLMFNPFEEFLYIHLKYNINSQNAITEQNSNPFNHTRNVPDRNQWYLPVSLALVN